MHIKTAPLIGAALVGFCDRQCRVCAVRCARTSTERSEASSEEEKENENERPKKTTITQAPCSLHFFSFILVCAEKKRAAEYKYWNGKEYRIRRPAAKARRPMTNVDGGKENEMEFFQSHTQAQAQAEASTLSLHAGAGGCAGKSDISRFDVC